MRMTGKRKSLIYSVPNTIFQKLNQTHLTHTGIIEFWPFLEVNEYDRLYELQNYFGGDIWTEFKNRSELKCSFFKDLKLIDQHDITCLWFFRERPDTAEYRKYCRDNNLDPYKDFKEIVIEGKNIKYLANTILITNKKIKFLENKFVLRRPCVQIDLRSIDIQSRKKIKQMLKRELD